MSFMFYATTLTFSYLFAENLYSFFKKDGVYTTKESVTNYVTGIVLKLISNVDSYYFGGFFILFGIFGYTYKPFSVASFLSCLIVIDFFYYLLHRMKHKVNFFWTFHHVHHSGKDFNMSTYLRTSWVEHLFLLPFPLLPALFIGFNPYLIISVSYFLFIYQFYCHSSYIKLPRWLDLVFVTPYNHSIHHDEENSHHNSNFGVMLSLWDRVFHSYTANIKSFTPGLKNYKQFNVIKIQLDPIQNYRQSILKKKNA